MTPGPTGGSALARGGDVVAHGIGGQKDLPIPLELAVAGSVAALVVSFTVLAVAWRRPRYEPVRAGRPVPAALESVVTSRGFAVALRAFGLVLFLYTAAAAVFGRDSLINPFFGIFAVWLWVGIVPMSLLFGPFWKAISPVRTINLLLARLTGGDPDVGLYRYPERLGLWPAALGLYAFVWLELVVRIGGIAEPRLWCAVYVGVMLVGGVAFGNRFFESCDPFEVYSSLVARLSVWGHHEDRLVLRSPLANLATVRPRPGLVVVLGVLFGSTGFDSFSDSVEWIGFVQGSSVNGDVLANLGLLTFCAAATAIFAVGSALTGVGPDQRRRELPDAFAHSLVPIVVAYVVAHYLTYFVEIGSRTLILASDPFSRGWNMLGTASWSEVTWLSFHPTLLAVVKVLAVVVGHVAAAVAAHDRALTLLPRRHQLTGQLPLLVAMVGFTAGGLYLLFAA